MNMIDYIWQQPDLFTAALKDRRNIAKGFVDAFVNGAPDCIYLIASGTSHNACLAARKFMQDILQVPVTVLPSSRSGAYFGRPLVLYVSQGGNSTNTIKAIESDKAMLTLAVTGNPDGHINTICTHRIEIPCGEETAGPKTKGYTMTILLLYLASLETALCTEKISEPEYNRYVDILENVASNLKKNIEISFEWAKKNENLLSSIKCLYVIGKDIDGAVAAEGALKVMETFLVPASSFEFEEYLHGPSCSISSAVSGIYLNPHNSLEDSSRMEKLVSYHRGYNPNVFFIGGTDSDERSLQLDISNCEYMSPFEYILPMQVISAVIPEVIGNEGEGSKRFKALDQLLKVKFKAE